MSSSHHSWSNLGKRLAAKSSIETLMDDLGKALAQGEDLCLMGGGNPASIPAVEQVWRREMETILADPSRRFEKMLGNYDAPHGNQEFIEALANLLCEEYGWQIGPENIAITNGGQSALYALFNLLCGKFEGGSKKKVLLPMVPEYIGYANQGHTNDMFTAKLPVIERCGNRQFKYRVDFDSLEIDSQIGAVCVSRPTNPTGNLITDEEIRQLDLLCKQAGVPLIIDSAYGTPFPQIIFQDATPFWNENTIVTLSLSKIGLPGTRTGVVIAHPEITKAIHRSVAIMSLANGNVGQAIIRPLIQSREILDISQNTIKPFYQKRSQQAQQWAQELLPEEVPWNMHLSEGALFLWFWFENLPISSCELYEKLKQRGVIVVPGEHFFFGLSATELADYQHSRQCIRVSFGGAEEQVKEGFHRLAQVLREVYQNA